MLGRQHDNTSGVMRACLLLLCLLAGARALLIRSIEAVEEAELPNSTLQVVEVGSATPAPTVAGPSDGYSTAEHWRNCSAWAKGMLHRVDTVASLRHGFMFVDNVKAGSTSVRAVISRVLKLGWWESDMPHNSSGNHWIRSHNKTRTTTISFSPSDIASLFRFSFVRDPVEKFESGVRQARRKAKFESMTADEMLEKQLSMRPGRWMDEHLQPSSYRLGALTSDGERVDLTFIGKVGSMRPDWAAIVGYMSNTTAEERHALKVHLRKANSVKPDPRDKLSPSGLRRMCESEIYGSEWACFDYVRPAVCG